MKPETFLKITRSFMRLICRMEITGQENVPRTGAAILVINHLGIFDPPLGYVAVDRPDMTGWVADKHKTNPLYSYFVRVAGGIWINRETIDMQALRKALQALKAGRMFGLAPEGTRSPTGAMIQAKEGASYLAIASGAPIIPVAITGTEKMAAELSHLRRARVSLRIGKPFNLPPMDRLSRQQAMDRGTDEIMCHIAALLPAQYRGVYADHPRLKELLAAAPA